MGGMSTRKGKVEWISITVVNTLSKELLMYLTISAWIMYTKLWLILANCLHCLKLEKECWRLPYRVVGGCLRQMPTPWVSAHSQASAHSWVSAHAYTTFQGVSVVASIQMYAIKCPCGPKSWVMCNNIIQPATDVYLGHCSTRLVTCTWRSTTYISHWQVLYWKQMSAIKCTCSK